MEKSQTETMYVAMEAPIMESDISLPIQTLFDECLSFISVNDFIF